MRESIGGMEHRRRAAPVREGQLTTLDLGPLVERHNRLAVALVSGVR